LSRPLALGSREVYFRGRDGRRGPRRIERPWPLSLPSSPGRSATPQLRFEFSWGATLPNGKPAQDWVKGLPGRRFDRREKTWYITGTGTNPDKFFAAARIPVDFSEATGDLAGLDSLETLWRPMLKRSSRFPHMVFVRPRMAGYERLATILGPGAVWDKNLQRFEVQLSDMITNDGQPKKGMQMDAAMITDAVASRQAEDIPENVRAAARELACSTGVDGDFQNELSPRAQELIDIVASHTGYLPKWFGLALYPFQMARRLRHRRRAPRPQRRTRTGEVRTP